MSTYRIINRITKETYDEIKASSAQEACEKVGWLIGDCYVRLIKKRELSTRDLLVENKWR